MTQTTSTTTPSMKLVSPCCGARLIPVMESAGSYMGDDFAGLECLDCVNTWDTKGELNFTLADVNTAEGTITLFGHPEKMEEKREHANKLVEKYGIDSARNRILSY